MPEVAGFIDRPSTSSGLDLDQLAVLLLPYHERASGSALWRVAWT